MTVSLALRGPQNTRGASTDTLLNFENLSGSRFTDVLSGNAVSNVISGGDGDDVITASSGDDKLEGGNGVDTADYSALGGPVRLSASGGVSKGAMGSDVLIAIKRIIGSSGRGDIVDLSGTVAPATGTDINLMTGAVTISGGAPLPRTFSISQFEDAIGSGFDDVITGNGASNSLRGEAGNDRLVGSEGDDRLDGGAGSDTADYNALGTTVVLGAFGTVSKGALGTDTLVGIERIIGSSRLGDRVDLSGARAPATSTFTNLATGVVTISGSGAPLPLSFSISQFENVTGSGFADSINGDAGANTLSGLAGDDMINGGIGNDVLNGGAGIDTASYASAGAGVTVSLALAGAHATGGAGTDTLIGFENLTGSRFADSLTGDALANRVEGGLSNDVLVGGGGRHIRLPVGDRVDTGPERQNHRLPGSPGGEARPGSDRRQHRHRRRPGLQLVGGDRQPDGGDRPGPAGLFLRRGPQPLVCAGQHQQRRRGCRFPRPARSCQLPERRQFLALTPRRQTGCSNLGAAQDRHEVPLGALLPRFQTNGCLSSGQVRPGPAVQPEPHAHQRIEPDEGPDAIENG